MFFFYLGLINVDMKNVDRGQIRAATWSCCSRSTRHSCCTYMSQSTAFTSLTSSQLIINLISQPMRTPWVQARSRAKL